MMIHASGEFWSRVISEIDPVTADFSKSVPAKPLPSFCKSHLKPGDRVLDLGCGRGRNAQYLVEQGYELFGMDIAPGSVEFCRERLRRFDLTGDFRQGDFRKIPFEADMFHGIVCISALDHVTLTGAGEALKEMRRVLEPRGCMLLTFDPPGRDEEIKGEAVEQEDGSLYFISGEQHGMLFRRYTDEEIKSLLGEHTIQSFTYGPEGDRIIICG